MLMEITEILEVKLVQIINTNLITKPIARRRVTNRIVVHHTAGSDHSAAEIHRMHLNRKFSGIGYHYIVRANGAIERGRPEELRGAHAGKANVDSVGIGLTGNFEKRLPTTAQMDALVWLIGDIRQRLGQDITVIRHSDVMATLCPGRLFPWAQLQARISTKEREYTVREGDTLWSIASAQMGNGTRWVEIQKLNDMAGTAVRVGQILRLPGD